MNPTETERPWLEFDEREGSIHGNAARFEVLKTAITGLLSGNEQEAHLHEKDMTFSRLCLSGAASSSTSVSVRLAGWASCFGLILLFGFAILGVCQLTELLKSLF